MDEKVCSKLTGKVWVERKRVLSCLVPDVVRYLLVEPTLAMVKVVTLAKSMPYGIKMLT